MAIAKVRSVGIASSLSPQAGHAYIGALSDGPTLTQIGNCSRNPRRKGGDSTAAGQAYNGAKEAIMNEDVFNASIRKFLKTLGVGAQREIEKAVRQALAQGKLKGNEKFAATATVTVGGIGLSHEVKGEIELE
jgi:hypothetical protein